MSGLPTPTRSGRPAAALLLIILLVPWAGCGDDPAEPLKDDPADPVEDDPPEELEIWETFVTIPAGTFTMGAPADEPGSDYQAPPLSADEAERPQHEVTLTRSFLMQATEVTQLQYMDLANWALENGYATADETGLYDALDDAAILLLDVADVFFCEIEWGRGALRLRDIGHGLNENVPAHNMTWYGAAAYCDWLSLQEGLPPAYDHGDDWSCNGGDPYGAVGYRLPTEAEWEYACRARSTTAFANGPCTNPYGEPNPTDPVDPVLSEIGWYLGNSEDWLHPVALKPPNDWGLYDMHGNLLKWCQGYWYRYGADPVSDPVGGARPLYRPARGGAWSRNPYYARSAFRIQREMDYRGPKQGFRPVRTVTP